MRIRKLFLLFMFFLFCSFLTFDARSEGPPATHSEITSIEVRENNEKTEIKITSDAPFEYTLQKVSDPYQIVVELQNAGLGEFRDKIVFDRAGVSEIIPISDESTPDISKLKIAFTAPVDVAPSYNDKTLILAFVNPDRETGNAGTETGEALPESPIENKKPFESNEYVGEKINIDFQDADLVHVFRLISDISGYNVVVSPDVKGKFSMKLIDVPWDQALDVILRNYGLSKTMEGNIIRIAPTSVIAKEEEEIAQAKESQEKSGDLVTRVYSINYAHVDEIKKAIDTAKILTKRGFISIDARTSSVIIKDVEKMHTEYENLIRSLDVPTPQVSIDAKIVEVNTNYAKELGIQWGFNRDVPPFKIGGFPINNKGNGFNSNNPLIVDLPATVSRGKGAGIGIGYISPSGLFKLDLQLSALESTGKGKVISNPKVTTNDNQEARIMQGKRIPYQTVSQSGTQTQFMDALLELTVTPHITPEGTIVMNVLAKKNEADFAGPQVLGVPTIDIKEVKTQVLVRDNDTLVIGGIFKTNVAKNREGVPVLSDIPVLGKLFQYNKDVNETTELLIFITPRLVKQEKI
jgi:type IV pilus assembly protein PilQ